MNRILRAEVILTLTKEQAAAVAASLSWAERHLRGHDDESARRYLDAWESVVTQVRRQGVAA